MARLARAGRHDPGVSSGDSEQRPLEGEQRVTPLELFFDLMFVFAITQVTGFIAAHPTWTRLVEALAILAVLWWAWVAYAWLGNTRRLRRGRDARRAADAMGPLLVALAGSPRARSATTPLIFGVAYLAVRAPHLVGYLLLARDDPALRGLIVAAGEHDAPGRLAARARGAARRRAARALLARGTGRRLRRPGAARRPRAGACSRRTSPSATD